MRPKFTFLTTTKSRAKIWRQSYAFTPPPLPVCVGCCTLKGGGSVVVGHFYCTSLWLLGFCVCLSYYVLLYVHSSFAIILKRKRKLVALLLLSYRCLVTVNILWLFLMAPWVGLQCVIVVFSGHTYLLSVTVGYNE